MFGGPATRDPSNPSIDKDPVGDYKLTHEMSVIAEKLRTTPGEIMQLDIPCPACHGELVGRANKYTRSVMIRCQRCTFRVNR